MSKNKYPFDNKNTHWIKNKKVNKDMSQQQIIDEITRWTKEVSPYNEEFNDCMFYSLIDIVISGYLDKLKYLYNIELEGYCVLKEDDKNG